MIKEKKSQQELEMELLATYDLSDCIMDKKFENEIIEGLKTIPALSQYLQITADKDIMRYFAAQDDAQRALVRGAFLRTIYLKNLVTSSKKLQILDKKK